MNLEPVTQSEESQQEKGKYHMLMHIYGVYKNVIDEPIFREGMEIHKERTGL